MAEGPLVHHYVNQLKKVLQGREVRIELRLWKLKNVESSLESIHIQKVEAHGKQFRIHLLDDRILLIHLMMWGSWRIYRKDEPWDRPLQRARVVFHTDSHVAVVFSAPVVKLLTLFELQNNPKWGDLGPDPLRSDFSSRDFFRRLEKDPSREIGEALLDQRVIAGVGNILRIEILFRSHIHSRRRIKSLSKKEKEELLRWILKLFEKWMKEIHRGSSWVQIYRRNGKPCPSCGTPIEFFRQAGRITYACSKCQR
ncbi:MAG: Fpg/Nei family DNA glycosylase [Thermodesulfobacteriota bacterium]